MRSSGRPLSVLITADAYPPDFRGGGEEIVRRTAVHLRARGVEVRVISAGAPRQAFPDGIEVVRVPGSRYALNLAAPMIRRYARSADLIHAFTYHSPLPALFAGRTERKPVVCTALGLFGDVWLELKGPLAGRAFRRWESFLLRRGYDRVSFLSDYSREIGLRWGVPPDRAVVATPGVAPEWHTERAADAVRDAVLFVGKLEKRKGVLEVLAAAEALPHVPFRLVGWGPLEGRIRDSGLPNVQLRPLLRGAQLRREFERAGIFLFPSRAETLGLVVVEAMASGCPVVSTVPLDYAGAFVPVGDRGAITAAVAGLWDADAERRAMGEENRRRAAPYTWERYADQVLESYEGVLRERGIVRSWARTDGESHAGNP